MSTLRSPLLMLFFAALAALFSGAASGKSTAEKVCLEGSGANVLHNLPRMTRSFQGAEADWGKLEPAIFIQCPGNPTEVCENPEFRDFTSDVLDRITSGPRDGATSESWDNYADSLFVYGVVGVALAVLFVVVAITFFSMRSCCGLCGGSRVKEDGVYSDTQVLGTSCLLFIFVVTLAILILIGEFKGNRNLTDAQYEVVDGKGPDGVRTLLAKINDPLATVVASASSTVASTIKRVNATVTSAVDLPKIHNSFTCLDDALEVVSEQNVQFFIDTIDQVDASLDKLPEKANVNAQLDSLTTVVDDTKPITDNAKRAISDISGNVSLIDVDDVLSDYDLLRSTLQPTLRDNLVSINQGFSDLSGSGLPTSQGATDASTLAKAIRDNSADRNKAKKDDLRLQLNTLRSQMNNLPDTDALADNFAASNSAIDTVQSTVVSIESKLLTFKGIADTFPDSIGRVTSALDDGISLVDGFDIDAIKASLESVQEFLDSLPDVSTLNAKIKDIQAIDKEVPCILDIVDEIKAVNASLVVLPAEFDDVEANIEKLNATVENDLKQLDDATDFLDDLNAKLQEIPNFDTGLAELDKAKTALADVKTSLNSAKSEVQTINSDITQPLSQLDDILAKVGEIKTQTSSTGLLKVSNDAIQGLRDLNAAKATSATLLTEMMNVLDAWESAGFPYPNNFPEEQLTQTSTLLDAVAIDLAALPDPAAVVTASNAAIDTVDETLSVGFDRNKFNQLKSDIDAIKPKLDDYNANLDDFESKVQSINSEFDVSSLKSETNNLFSAVETARTDLASYRTSAVDFKNQVVQLRQDFEVDSIIKTEKQVYNLVFSNLTTFVAELETYGTKVWMKSNSLEGAVRKIIDALVVILQELDVQDIDIDAQYASSVIPKILKSLDGLEGTSSYGAAYDLATFMDDIVGEEHTASQKRWFGTGETFDKYDEPLVWGYVDGGGIYPYPARASDPFEWTCITSKCLRNTIKRLNTDTSFGPANDGYPELPVSRETAMSLSFIFPCLLLLLSIWVLCCGSGSTCLVIFMVIMAPFIFVIIGGLAWPGLMAAGDACASTESLATVSLKTLSPTVCSSFSDSSFVDGLCQIAIDIKVRDTTSKLNLALDFPEIAQSLMLNCAATSLANGGGEPISALWSAVKTQAAEVSREQIDDFKSNLPDGVELRSSLLDEVDAAREEVVKSVENVIESLSQTLGCSETSGAYQGLKSSMCCDTVGAAYFYLASFYWMAWAILFCGCPAAVLAQKRFFHEENRTLYSRINNAAESGSLRYNFKSIRMPGRTRMKDDNFGNLPEAVPVQVVSETDDPSWPTIAMVDVEPEADKFKGSSKKLNEAVSPDDDGATSSESIHLQI